MGDLSVTFLIFEKKIINPVNKIKPQSPKQNIE